jgi:predicted  nucleic acid-binding Zn-ribbon protein
MSQVLNLYRLQQTDTNVDRIQSRLQAIQNKLDSDIELKSAAEKVDAVKELYNSTDKTLKQSELDAQNQRIKIEQIEASLYSGKGHSPKELLDLQNDVAALKRHLLVLEDLQLEAMLETETSLDEYNSAQIDLLKTKERSSEQNNILQEEQTALRKEMEKYLFERAAIASQISSDMLRLFEELRLQRRGIAVAVISDNSCSACGSSLSPAQMQSSRSSGQVAMCPSCGRILYGSKIPT